MKERKSFLQMDQEIERRWEESRVGGVQRVKVCRVCVPSLCDECIHCVLQTYSVLIKIQSSFLNSSWETQNWNVEVSFFVYEINKLDLGL